MHFDDYSSGDTDIQKLQAALDAFIDQFAELAEQHGRLVSIVTNIAQRVVALEADDEVS